MDVTDGSLPLEALVDAVEGGLFVLDAEGRIVWTDAAFRHLVDEANGDGDVDRTGHHGSAFSPRA